MNYFDYINGIEPPAELKEKIKFSIKSKLQEEQKKKSTRNRAILGLVACLTIFVGAFSLIKISMNGHYIDDNSSITSENNSNKDKILIITENNDNKSLPQEIVVNNVYYRQYCSSNLKNQLKTDNGNIVIKESEIGELICGLNEKNIFNVETQGLENVDAAKKNEFYNADVYKYNPLNDNSNIIVKTTTGKYYFFRAVNLEKLENFEKITELYSLDSSNKIDNIEVWQDEIVEDSITGFDGNKIAGITSKDALINKIENSNETDKIVDLLRTSKTVDYINPDDIYFDIHRNKINESMKSTNQYRLIINLSNGNSFEIWMCLDSKYIQVLESTYFELDSSAIQEIIEIVKE